MKTEYERDEKNPPLKKGVDAKQTGDLCCSAKIGFCYFFQTGA